MNYVINCTHNHSKPEVKFHSTFSSIITFLRAWEEVNVSNCYSVKCCEVAKNIYRTCSPKASDASMPATKFLKKKLRVVNFLRAGHMLTLLPISDLL